MSDELRVQLPQTSRSGRVVKKSLKWRESEETYSIDEMNVKQSSRRSEKFTSSSGKFTSSNTLLNAEQWSLKSSGRESCSEHSFSAPRDRYDRRRRKNKVFPTEIAEGSKKKHVSILTYYSAECCKNDISSWRPSKSIEVTTSSSSDSTSASSDGSSTSEYEQHHDLSSSETSLSSEYFTEKISDIEISNISESDNKRDATNEESIENSAPVTKTQTADKSDSGKVNRNRKTSRTIVNTATNSKKASSARISGRKKLSSYMLWSHANRKRIFAMHKHLSLQQINKKVGEAWKALPEKEKDMWKIIAKQESLKSSTADYGIVSVPSSNEAPTYSSHPATSSEVLGIAPIDAAAHLKLLGSSLTDIGLKLFKANCEPSTVGVNSVLLDALLCAVGPLLCLSRSIAGLENLPEDSFKKTLDHIAYFFPGL